VIAIGATFIGVIAIGTIGFIGVIAIGDGRYKPGFAGETGGRDEGDAANPPINTKSQQ
jgi:hypothetical protein